MKRLALKFNLSIALASMISLPVLAEGWSGKGEAGLVKASGNTDSTSANLGLGFINESGIWKHELGFAYFNASNNGNDTAKSLAADYIAKRDLTERSYLFGKISHLDDDFDGFTEQDSVAAGYGYHVIDTEKVGLELGIGIGYRDTSELTILADGSELKGKDLSNATGVFLMSYRNQLTDNTQFVDGFKAEAGSDNTFIENDASLIVAMNEKFALKAGILIRHNTDPSPGADETDTISTINLVYNIQ